MEDSHAMSEFITFGGERYALAPITSHPLTSHDKSGLLTTVKWPSAMLSSVGDRMVSASRSRIICKQQASGKDATHATTNNT
uniref:Uncharacterized protein n=1 Tax=Anguilla anguilla TaxID=7936 RepID=A0A0E9P6U3_ANGAN